MTGTEPCTAQSKSFQETWKKEKLDEDQLHGLVLDVALERWTHHAYPLTVSYELLFRVQQSLLFQRLLQSN